MMLPLNTRLTLSALTLVGALGLAGCAAGNSRTTPEESSSSSATTASPSSSSTAESFTSPTEGPNSSPSNKDLPAPVPTESANGANLSVFKAEITDASVSKTPVNQMHEVPGEQAIKATVKLTNLSDSPADATLLSFPVLINGATPVPGITSENNKLFSSIKPHQSQEVTFYFPTKTPLENIKLNLDDSHGTSTTLTHPLK
ncbi:MAG: hypothetical protein Q3974_00040 [Rothia sp. (in: high G+C Gram-positive bacteria)]|nr:hypothetical protein [Rothia sp. (in: high G+C Gram-positive bacteria)]